MGHAVFVFGAAGAGKTTFCRNMREAAGIGRQIKLVNLDPAVGDASDYDVDLCEHVDIEAVMQDGDFGPNGGLFAALKMMVEQIDALELQQFEDEYFFFDCPGQIELFLHSMVLHDCISHVRQFAKVAIVYMTDATTFYSPSKYLHSALCTTICMSHFEYPLINVLSKTDLVDEEMLERILSNEEVVPETFAKNRFDSALLEYVEHQGLLDYLPLDWKNEDTVENILLQLDNVLQRFDDVEPHEKPEQ
ncbi:GPN-loop GTPase [Pancytospora philotis]|nr:GPN-loop GTPase [Pancytospora philotis]